MNKPRIQRLRRCLALWVVFAVSMPQMQLSFGRHNDSFKVKYVGGFPSITKKHQGLIQFDNAAGEMVFLKNGKRRLFSIPYRHITVVSADEKARRRVKETVILGVTLIGLFALPILFSKKKMRFVLVEFRDAQNDTAGAAMFRVKKRHKLGLMVAAAERADLERRGEDLFARQGSRTDVEVETDQAQSAQLSPVAAAGKPDAGDVEDPSPATGAGESNRVRSVPVVETSDAGRVQVVQPSRPSLAHCLSFDNLQSAVLDNSGDYWTVAWKVDVMNRCSESFRVEVVFTAYDEEKNRLEEAGEVVQVAADGATRIETKMAIKADQAKVMALEGVGLRAAP